MTVKEVKEILGDKYLSKARGQNLLLDENIAKKFAYLVSTAKNKKVLEIGPGLGIITKYLKNRNLEVIAVEIDPDFCRHLENLGIKVVCEDFLKMKLDTSFPEIAAGALPFSVSVPILKKIKDNRDKIKEWTFVLQKEVAERICAGPGKLSVLALSVRIYGEPEIVGYVHRSSFYPAPKVDSAILKIKNIRRNHPAEYYKNLFRIIKIGFSSKRKKLANNLSAGLRINKEDALQILAKAKINPNARAQELGLEEWKKLERLTLLE